MGSTTVGHMIFYVAMFIIMMIAIFVLLATVTTQVSFWILRPSEMAAMDLVGTVTSLGGTSGEVTTEFKTYTANVIYYMNRMDKILCVISQRKQSVSTPIVGVLTTFNCFSMPFTPDIYFISHLPVESSEFTLHKRFQDPFVWVGY